MKLSTISLALLLVLILAVTGPAVAITCSDVAKDLSPCVKYLVSGSGKPPKGCCSGASALASATSSAADKRTACECIKSTSKNLKLNAQLAKDLPSNCGITLPFDVSPDVDCSTIG